MRTLPTFGTIIEEIQRARITELEAKLAERDAAVASMAEDLADAIEESKRLAGRVAELEEDLSDAHEIGYARGFADGQGRPPVLERWAWALVVTFVGVCVGLLVWREILEGLYG